MKKLLFLIVAVTFIACDSMPTESEAYLITQNLLKEKFKSTVNEMDFPFSDYKHDYLNDSTFLIVSYFNYKNDYNVKKRFGYKARIKYKGGDWSNDNNWELMYVEEYNY